MDSTYWHSLGSDRWVQKGLLSDFVFSEVDGELYIEGREDVELCYDEILSVTPDGKSYYYISGAVVRASPLLIMLREREGDSIFVALPEKSLRICLEVAMGIMVTERRLDRNTLSSFFLTHRPLNWLDADPEPERVVEQAKRLNLVCYTLKELYRSEMETILVSFISVAIEWYKLTNEHNMRIYDNCELMAPLLYILCDPRSVLSTDLLVASFHDLSSFELVLLGHLVKSIYSKTLQEVIETNIAMVPVRERDIGRAIRLCKVWIEWAVSPQTWKGERALKSNIVRALPDEVAREVGDCYIVKKVGSTTTYTPY